MKIFRMITILFLIVIFCLSGTVLAQEQKWSANAKFGLLFPGTVTISPPGVDVDTEMGWILNLKADALMSPKFSIGALVSFAGTSAEESSESVSIMNFGGTMKAWFPLESGWHIRPGAVLAYQLTTSDAFDDVSGLNVGAFVEGAVPLKNKYRCCRGTGIYLTTFRWQCRC